MFLSNNNLVQKNRKKKDKILAFSMQLYFDAYYLFIFYLVFFQLLAYFAERMISTETLRRNSVMQRKYDGQVHNHTELRK